MNEEKTKEEMELEAKMQEEQDFLNSIADSGIDEIGEESLPTYEEVQEPDWCPANAIVMRTSMGVNFIAAINESDMMYVIQNKDAYEQAYGTARGNLNSILCKMATEEVPENELEELIAYQENALREHDWELSIYADIAANRKLYAVVLSYDVINLFSAFVSFADKWSLAFENCDCEECNHDHKHEEENTNE